MKTLSLKHLAIGLAMLVAAGLAVALVPHRGHANSRINLENMFHKQIGNWQADDSVMPVQVSPEREALIKEIYNQTLSRTYVDPQGQRIMLSIAYGGSYGKGMQTHKPEICYPAQGFQIKTESTPWTINAPYGPIHAKRLAMEMGSRVEPITYWLVVGGEQTQFGGWLRLTQIKNTLTGVIPDGMLIRVSTIGSDVPHAWQLQEAFIKELLASMSDSDRRFVLGLRAG